MNSITQNPMQTCRDGYCSQLITPFPLIVEKGVEAIVSILAKTVLCRHDVQEINKIYRTIDHLEKQISQIPKSNSLYILEKIVEKIEKIIEEKNIFGLISLYHLQDFLDQDLFIEKHFSQVWSQVEKKPEMLKQLAIYLSCCHSGQRREKLQHYPSFFQELLENGYLYLYHHLMQMRALSDRFTRLSENLFYSDFLCQQLFLFFDPPLSF